MNFEVVVLVGLEDFVSLTFVDFVAFVTVDFVVLGFVDFVDFVATTPLVDFVTRCFVVRVLWFFVVTATVVSPPDSLRRCS